MSQKCESIEKNLSFLQKVISSSRDNSTRRTGRVNEINGKTRLCVDGNLGKQLHLKRSDAN